MGSNAIPRRRISSSRTLEGAGQRRWRRWAAPAALALALSWSSSVGAADDAEALGTSCDDTSDCLFTALTGVVSGFTGGAGDSLWGWMMGGGQSAGISAISSELGTIEGTLTTIENELADIEAELKAIECGFDTNFIDAEAGPIQSYYQTYANWLTDMCNADASGTCQNNGALPSVTDVSEWANCAVGFPVDGQTCAIASGTDILTLMDDVNDAATAGSGSGGSIFDCIVAHGSSAPAENTLDDRPYYTDNVLPITNWYLTVNTQAMIVLTEAYHFRAWQAAGSPTSSSADDIYSNVCPTGATRDGCLEPITVYNNDFLSFAKGQFQAGGAPYSTDDYVMQNGTDYLVQTSLEAYTIAAGGGCGSGTLSSASPCGFTVGLYDAPTITIAYGPYGYGGPAGDYGTWVTAPESLFSSLLDQGFNGGSPNDVSAGEFLCTMSLTCSPSSTNQCSRTTCTQANGGAGLFGIEEKILLFDETTSGGWIGEFIGQPVICFLDGGIWNGSTSQPFCAEDNSLRYRALLKDNGGSNCGNFGSEFQMWTESDFTTSEVFPDFYTASVCLGPVPLGVWQTPPQYAIQAPGQHQPTPAKQFRWPMLDWTELSCSNGKAANSTSNLNPAGVPKLCGADFDTWFNTQVPPGPTTTTASADATFYRADRNRNDGAGTRLILAGKRPLPHAKRAVVAFDQDKVQAFLDGGPLDQALLVLTSADQSGDGRSHWVAAFPLDAGFVEGNGNAAERDRGTGPGATWNCAEDADISGQMEDCVQDWPRPIVNRRDGIVVSQEDGYTGPVSWDVTEHVERGFYAWLLQARSGRSLSYISREGAAAIDDPSLAPTLILVRGTEEAVVAEADLVTEGSDTE